MRRQTVPCVWLAVTAALATPTSHTQHPQHTPHTPTPPNIPTPHSPSYRSSSSLSSSSTSSPHYSSYPDGTTTTTIIYHHYQDPPDVPSPSSSATTLHHRHQFSRLRHNHHPESMEDQVAVLTEMRVECELKMRNEEREKRKGRAGTPIKSSSTDTTTTADGGIYTSSSTPNAAPSDPLVPPGFANWKENEEHSEGDDTEVENGGRGLGSVKENESVDGFCPTTFDNIYCWPRTAPDKIVTIPCPGYVKNFMRGNNATRYCTSEGTWYTLEGTNQTWTNYSQCSATLVVPLVMNSTMGMWVPVVRVVSLVGYSVSLATLLVAFSVLACIKRLRCPRNTLHMHLFLSFICRAIGALARNNDINDIIALEPDSDGGTWGCRLFTSLWQYFILANYSWILMEGLYLHNLIFLALFTDNSAITLYIVLGWGLPLILVGGWVVARVAVENTLCWFTHDHAWVFWTFVRGPVGISILVSFALFVNIARELLLKLKSSTTPESRRCRYRRWARSTLVLVPLFGVHYAMLLGFTFFMGKNSTIEIMWLFTDQFFASFQGFFVATLYCLLNGEVRSELHKIWHHWQMNSKTEKSINFHSALSQSRTYFRGTGAPWASAFASGKRKDGSAAARKTSDEMGMSRMEKTNGSPAQATCLSVLDDTQNQVSLTTSLAVVELQPTPDTINSTTTHLQEAADICARGMSPDGGGGGRGGGDKACVLLLQPLSHVTHDLIDMDSSPLRQHAGDQNSDSMLGEMPPMSSILYDTPGDSCEGSPLLPNISTSSHPSHTESTF
ncbi:parathyroid hormone/parathyroid hormone-related peptide receptor-like isoform X2 [Eriocheir sinensis]|uniref:parathyroid hormone/parathyroid hormone-related peptide receptor-like isoform X2 n=1 Tax=Eriocheir sinensis TaxID=95602 RepID=UPI0021C66BC4|nr:parathyroid hormone/parathyroid hormone-related peptide receptor-like isoform X2 [Eriocheir sinensis]